MSEMDDNNTPQQPDNTLAGLSDWAAQTVAWMAKRDPEKAAQAAAIAAKAQRERAEKPVIEARKKARQQAAALAEAADDAAPIGSIVEDAKMVKRAKGKEDKGAALLSAQKAELRRIRKQEERKAVETLKAAYEGKLMGRPTTYTKEEASKICAWIAQGNTLTSYCKTTGLSMFTVYDWMARHNDFAQLYAQARLDRTETQIEEVIDLADSALECDTREQIEGRKLAVDTRKWVIAKLNSKYSDRQQQATAAAITFNIDLGGQLSHNQPPTITLEPALDKAQRPDQLSDSRSEQLPQQPVQAALPVRSVDWAG